MIIFESATIRTDISVLFSKKKSILQCYDQNRHFMNKAVLCLTRLANQSKKIMNDVVFIDSNELALQIR